MYIIFNLAYEDGRVEISFAAWLLIVIVVALAAFIAFRMRLAHGWRSFRAESVTLSAGGSSFTLKVDHSTIRIAHATWTELATRKASLPFDEENDVVVEVYDSWYALFGELRGLLRSLPAEDLTRSANARKLTEFILQVMNGALRNHLTKWQARFRFWYSCEMVNNTTEEPQHVQRRYPQYTEMVSDLKMVNEELSELTGQLKRLVVGGK